MHFGLTEGVWMTGAKAAMDRVFVTRDRLPLRAGQLDALTDLAAQVRELNHAVIHTDLPPAEITEVTALLADLTDRLGMVTREAPPILRSPDGTISQPSSPASGYLNPLAPPIEIHVQPGGVSRTEFTLSDIYEGPPGFVHGGISALILDDLLGNAAAANGTPGMTATLDLR